MVIFRLSGSEGKVMASLLHQAILRWASPRMAFLVIQKSNEVLFLSTWAYWTESPPLQLLLLWAPWFEQQSAQLASMWQKQLNQFLLPLVWYFLTSSQKLPPLRKGKKTDESVIGLFRLLTCIHTLLDFLAVRTDRQWLRLQDTDRGEISIHITVLFRPSQGIRSDHMNTISPHYKQGRWREEEELGSSAWWQASCVSTACNWHNVNSKTFGTVCCYQD